MKQLCNKSRMTTMKNSSYQPQQLWLWPPWWHFSRWPHLRQLATARATADVIVPDATVMAVLLPYARALAVRQIAADKAKLHAEQTCRWKAAAVQSWFPARLLTWDARDNRKQKKHNLTDNYIRLYLQAHHAGASVLHLNEITWCGMYAVKIFVKSLLVLSKMWQDTNK